MKPHSAPHLNVCADCSQAAKFSPVRQGTSDLGHSPSSTVSSSPTHGPPSRAPSRRNSLVFGGFKTRLEAVQEHAVLVARNLPQPEDEDEADAQEAHDLNGAGSNEPDSSVPSAEMDSSRLAELLEGGGDSVSQLQRLLQRPAAATSLMAASPFHTSQKPRESLEALVNAASGSSMASDASAPAQHTSASCGGQQRAAESTEIAEVLYCVMSHKYRASPPSSMRHCSLNDSCQWSVSTAAVA